MLLGNNYSKTYSQYSPETTCVHNSLASEDVLIFIHSKQNTFLLGLRNHLMLDWNENRQAI